MPESLSTLEAVINNEALYYARKMKKPAEFLYLGMHELERLSIILSAKRGRSVLGEEIKLWGMTVIPVPLERHLRVA
jgi:hypothetical protein